MNNCLKHSPSEFLRMGFHVLVKPLRHNQIDKKHTKTCQWVFASVGGFMSMLSASLRCMQKKVSETLTNCSFAHLFNGKMTVLAAHLPTTKHEPDTVKPPKIEIFSHLHVKPCGTLRLAKYIFLDLPDRCMEFNAQLYPPKKCGRSFYQKA